LYLKRRPTKKFFLPEYAGPLLPTVGTPNDYATALGITQPGLNQWVRRGLRAEFFPRPKNPTQGRYLIRRKDLLQFLLETGRYSGTVV
jgi:hypothetical protein